MKKTWFEDILQFHLLGEQKIGDTPKIPDDKIVALRKRLIKEEVIEETLEAIEQNDLVAIADGLVDSIVVLIGTAIAYGIDLEEVWDEIHKSNMAKFKNGIVKDEGGKITKPEGWTPPNVKMILEAQKPLTESYSAAKYGTNNWTKCYVTDCSYRAYTVLPNKQFDPKVDARLYAPYCRNHAKDTPGVGLCQTSHPSQTSSQTTQTTNKTEA